VNYILDTHTLIWFLEGDDFLSENARKIIENEDHTKHISIVSLWEIAIKISLGKLALSTTLNDFLILLSTTEIKVLPISYAHILLVSQLEFLHKDPFDRIIIAQAQAEQLTIVGKDGNFSLYEVALYW
jgi:PIN domain nuclease of toxin-antitoxin system